MTKYLTPDGLAKLKKELEYLEKEKRKEVAERLRQAVSQGDLSENAGYDAARDEQEFVERRIKELKETIVQVKIIEKEKSNKVQIGSFVSLKSKEGKEEFQIVGSEEADVLNKRISFLSPLGEAILNKQEGETVKINTPGGEKEYKVVKIK
ncbi:MAG TPA: transcription elongation factor GreA [Candidatus Paceibacterota bacterium]|nr:transcription elongation factor GreA [Candidatus Paceibacterota bacterium]